MRIIIIVVVSLALAGCRANLVVPTGSEPDPRPDLSALECLSVTDGSIEGIRVGIQAIEPSNDVGRAVAVRIADGEWFVAAEIEGAGLTDTVGVWWTQLDPTTSESNAYNSVDGFAHQFSDYVQSPWYDVTSDGVDEVKACL